MAAYFLADLEIEDAAGFEEYRRLVPATIEQYKGRYLVRGGRHETLEGDRVSKRLVVLEFPSLDQAKRWYDSAEYQPLKALRQRTARADVILVEGV
jgi:uncharacterized protein (DUF1330 family)